MTLQSPPPSPGAVVGMERSWLLEEWKAGIQASNAKSKTAGLMGVAQWEERGRDWQPGQKDSRGIVPAGSP